jgi:peptidoglycan biosynthesis protein MviN/MurJ (putative lipid II flippase)
MALAIGFAMGPSDVWLHYRLVSKLIHLSALILLGAITYFGALLLFGIRIKDFMHRTVI